MMHELIAAVDLGSNSFRLQVARIVNDQVYPLDHQKDSVRLASGLSADKYLDEASQLRAITALSRFRERIASFPPGSVRAVATNTFRVAKNTAELLEKAERALGCPIEVIAGREEARLIYVGVAHTLPDPHRQQLVVDIGGGSTELIIGKSFKPKLLESLYMGCVGYTRRFFSDGRIEKQQVKAAETTARQELQTIVAAYRSEGWDVAVGSSGTAKVLSELLAHNGFPPGEISLAGLETLKEAALRAGSVQKLALPGLRADRMPVFMGGLSIMSAIFKEFEIEKMVFSEGALRLGVLYDLLGRYHHHDLRDATVHAFMKRYHLDIKQAQAVANTACYLLTQLRPETVDSDHLDRRFLTWAALLHEIGISVAHAGFHKHSAYIIANADMPGFSSMDQVRLSRLVLGQRGKISKVVAANRVDPDWLLFACLRLAVLFHRARDNRGVPPVMFSYQDDKFILNIQNEWLAMHPLTASILQDEQQLWRSVHCTLEITDYHLYPSVA